MQIAATNELSLYWGQKYVLFSPKPYHALEAFPGSQKCGAWVLKTSTPPGDCFGSSSFPLTWEAPVQLFVTLAVLRREDKESPMSRDRSLRAVQNTGSFCNLPGKPVCRQVWFFLRGQAQKLASKRQLRPSRSLPGKTHTSMCQKSRGRPAVLAASCHQVPKVYPL